MKAELENAAVNNSNLFYKYLSYFWVLASIGLFIVSLLFTLSNSHLELGPWELRGTITGDSEITVKPVDLRGTI